MGNKVCCKETKVDATKTMNERDYLIDILCSVALTEASNQKLNKEFKEIFDTVESLEREAYDLAWNNGWYSLEEAQTTKITEKQTSLQKKLDELSN